jgi:Xaa-Pro dipeptidase
MAAKIGKFGSILLFSSDAQSQAGANFFKHALAEIDGSAIVLAGKSKTLITSPMNESKARKVCKYKVIAAPPGKLADTLKKTVPPGKIGLDMENVSAARYLRLRKIFAKRLAGAGKWLESRRLKKSPNEIAKLRKACDITRKILSSLRLEPKMSELDVVALLRQECIKYGVEFSFPPIVAAGKNSSLPHHTPGKARLGRGIVLIDFGVKYRNYCSDMTRCYFLGKAQVERKKYNECKSAYSRIIRRLPAARTAGDIAKIAHEETEKAGWPAMIHAIGHGLGLEVHEAPQLYKKNREKMLKGMALAIEPGWYGKKFGARFENDIIWAGKRVVEL